MEIQPYAIPGVVDFGKYKYHPYRIIKIICEFYNISEAEIKSKCRKRKFATARYILYWCMNNYKKNYYMTLDSIGGIFNGNHCNALHGTKKINDLMHVDKSFRDQVEEIQKRIEAWKN